MIQGLRAVLLVCASAFAGYASTPQQPLDAAFERLYNFDFAGTHRLMDTYIAANPSDPLGYGVRASAVLFEELHRMNILEGEFFATDKRIASKRHKVPLDPARKDRFYQCIKESQEHANAALAKNPDDVNALFALSLTEGLVADYMALIEKRQLGSLNHAKQSNSYAVRLLKKRPDYADAHLTTGFSEYLLGSLPFFIRWFVKFEDVEGNKDRAVAKMERVIRSGRYLGPFAKILLAVYYLREKRPDKTRTLLSELAANFPENPLFKKELDRLSRR